MKQACHLIRCSIVQLSKDVVGFLKSLPLWSPFNLTGKALLAAAVFFSLFFSTTSQAESAAVKVEGIDIIDYGLYTTEDLFQSEEKTYWDFDSLSLFREADQIPAVLGLRFGLRYIIKGSPSDNPISITCKVLLPGLTNPKTGEKIFVDEWSSTKKIGTLTYDGYMFEREWELVPGKWTFQLYHGNVKLAEKEFNVQEYNDPLDTLLAEYYYSAHLFLESWENFQNRRYLGKIRHEKNMTLSLSKNGHELSGYLMYSGSSKRREVNGTVDRGGNAVFAEYKNINEKPERAYKGKFDDTFGKFTGIWLRKAGDRERPVTFRTSEMIKKERIAQPKKDREYQVKVLIRRLISDLSSPYGEKAQKAVFLLGRMKSNWVTDELLRVMKEMASKDTVYCSYDIRRFLEVLKGRVDNRLAVSILPLLSCADDNIEALAAEILGDQRAVSAITPLIPLLHHKYSFVRQKAAVALAKIGEPAVEPLLIALKEESALNNEAIWALGELKDGRAIPLLLQYLRSSNNDIRREAASALGKIGEPAIKPLIAAFKDKNIEVYFAAVEAFAKMGATALPPLLDTLNSEDPIQRSGAIKALGKLGDSRAVGPLIDKFQDTVDWVRITAADALAEMGKPAVTSLVQVFHSEEQTARRLAIRGLAGIKDPSVVESLIDASNDSSDDIRQIAVYALGELDDRRAIEPLMAALMECQTKKKKGPLHEYLITALGRLKDARAAGLLINEMDNNEGSSNYYVVKNALIRIGAPAAKDVSHLLQEGSVRERQAAIDVLQSIGDLTVADELHAALSDKDPRVRSGAAHALGIIKDIGAGDLLMTALKDSEPAVRVRAIEALGNIKDFRAGESMISALTDKNAEVKLVAIMSLGKLKDKRAIKPLIDIIKGEDIGVSHDLVHYRLHQEASRCLQEITGEFMTFPEGWEAWWLKWQANN